jgi:ribokinase
MLLLQLEIPMEVVVEAARLGRAHGLTVILDPAPGQPLPDELYGLVDILTPNTSEAASLVGFGVESVEDARRAAEVLHQRGVPVVVIKMGGLGVLLLTSEGNHYWKAFPVNVVDTVAAGDAFNGALAVALSEGGSLSEAVRWGLAAGALAVTKKGAQEAMPSREEVVSLLEK